MKKQIIILGISSYYHDSAAAIIVDGDIVAAAQEERFTRIKGDNSFPHHAIGYCLKEVNITLEQVDHIIFYEDSIIKFERILVMAHLMSPKGFISFLKSMPKWLTKNLWMEHMIEKELGCKKAIWSCPHHISHAASAFYPSPFSEAAFLTIDVVGEWSTTTYGVGKGKEIRILGESRYPNSLGLLYSAFTFYTGFKINSGEYKLMGLAPYGSPIFAELIKEKLIHIHEDGTIVLNQKYFRYTYSLETINKEFENLFGKKARKPESPITQHEMDVAASIQQVTNEVVLKMAEFVRKETKEENLVLAGGVALNVVTMGYIKRHSGFNQIWIQPASGDAGGALGAALYVWHMKLGRKRIVNSNDSMKGSFLGPWIKPKDVDDDKILHLMGGIWKAYENTELIKKVAELLSQNYIVGIARGRMEWGPRALGNRSILGSAQDVEMQSRLNLKIKFRESFRPFAPMVLKEDAFQYFDMETESPYMLRTEYVKEYRRLKYERNRTSISDIINQPRSDIPAITHLDYSARVQTVDRDRNLFIYKILEEYKKITGCSVIVNTSFNVRGEPIVNTAEDAFRCFMATEMDYVVIGNRLFEKKAQENQAFTEQEREKWLRRFELD